MRTERFSGIGSDGLPHAVFMRRRTTELEQPRQRRAPEKLLKAKFYLDNGDELVPTDDCTVFKTATGDLVVTLLAN